MLPDYSGDSITGPDIEALQRDHIERWAAVHPTTALMRRLRFTHLLSSRPGLAVLCCPAEPPAVADAALGDQAGLTDEDLRFADDILDAMPPILES